MSKSNNSNRQRAVALKYDGEEIAPIVVASGMGYLAEKMVETAIAYQVPVFEDDALATVLSQLELGQEIPEELYKAIVDIYVYFLNYSFKKEEKKNHTVQQEELQEK